MDIRGKINKNIAELNQKDCNLEFRFVDGKVGCSIQNRSTVPGYELNSFGTYVYHADDEASRQEAYKECNAYLEGLLAGIRLMDPKSYHNFIAQH